MNLPPRVEICHREVMLTQEEDTAGRVNETDQYLTLKTADGGGGPYIVIETERWAIDADEIDNFAEMLKGFMQR